MAIKNSALEISLLRNQVSKLRHANEHLRDSLKYQIAGKLKESDEMYDLYTKSMDKADFFARRLNELRK